MRCLAALCFGAGLAAALAGCEPEYGSEPFACADGITCPEGYACEAGVCRAAGERPAVTRAARVTYVNRSEMTWFASPEGGATLVYNDGFSPGARGIFEVRVAPDGAVTGPTKLLAFPSERPVSAAVVALDDNRYGVVTMSFPDPLEDQLLLELRALPREGRGAAGDAVLHTAAFPFFGGYEPAYVGAVVVGDEVVYAFSDPEQGGAVVLTRVRTDGELVDTLRIPLPEGVLPLSGDCTLWKSPSGAVMLRVGLEVQRVFSIDLEGGVATELPEAPGAPLYGFGSAVTYLVPSDDSTSAVYVTRDVEGAEIASSPPQAFSDGLEPYTGVPYGEGALIAPISSDDSFPTVGVAYLGADGTFSPVASVERVDTDYLYTARAIGVGGSAYVVWTTFHEQLMDVWIGVAPLSGAP